MNNLLTGTPSGGIDRVIELERLLADERERTQQLRGENAVMVGLLRDSLSVLETVDQDTYQDGFSLFFLRVAIGLAIDPQNREGGLL